MDGVPAGLTGSAGESRNSLQSNHSRPNSAASVANQLYCCFPWGGGAGVLREECSEGLIAEGGHVSSFTPVNFSAGHTCALSAVSL